MTLLLSNEDVEALLEPAELVDTLRAAFVELAHGRGAERPRTDIVTPGPDRDGALHALKSMDGVAPALGVAAVRIGSDVLTFPRTATGMRRVKVPAAPGERYVGLVLLFSTRTGEPLAIFPDGVVQAMRVGATSALAADLLARAGAGSAAILGSGWQAREQVRCLAAVRDLADVRVFSPDRAHRTGFARDMSPAAGVDIRPCASVAEACAGAAIVHCATNTTAPVVLAEHLEPGMHVATIRPAATELARDAWPRVDVMTLLHHHDHARMIYTHGVTIGEERDGGRYNLEKDDYHASLPTVPEILAGLREGRTGDRQITGFLNNGMGYQFAAAGHLVYRKARSAGRGRELPTEWFTQDVHT